MVSPDPTATPATLVDAHSVSFVAPSAVNFWIRLFPVSAT
jgi:hypothetical protein